MSRGPQRVDVHIGLSKTGTTTVQRTLRASAADLRAQGIVVARSLGVQNHHGLAVVGLPGTQLTEAHVAAGVRHRHEVAPYRRDRAQALRRECRGADRVVASNEHCSFLLRDPDSTRRLRDWLVAATGTEQVHVHVWLRRQDRHLESVHSTWLRGGHTARAPWWERPFQEPVHDYQRLLERWASAFGRDHVHPRRFVRAHLVDGDIVRDFEVALGLPRLPEVVSDTNTRLDGLTQQLLAGLNAYLPRDPWERAGFRTALNQALQRAAPTGPPSHRLPPATAAAVLDAYRESNDAVAREWFGVPHLFDETIAPVVPPPELTLDDALERIAPLLVDLGEAARPRSAVTAVREAVADRGRRWPQWLRAELAARLRR